MNRAEILKKAEQCVNGGREQDYGSPENNFKNIAEFWTIYKGVSFTPIDVAMMMALMKIARTMKYGGTDDSYVDLAGYAACGGELLGKIRSTITMGSGMSGITVGLNTSDFCMRNTGDDKA